MGTLPRLGGSEVVRAFALDGWRMVRQRGSHLIMVKEGEIASLSIPNHREIAKGTLRSLIRSSGLTVERFIELTMM